MTNTTPRRRRTPPECGWLKDGFGLSRRIVACALEEVLGDADAEGVSRVMTTLFRTTKLDFRALQAAYDMD